MECIVSVFLFRFLLSVLLSSPSSSCGCCFAFDEKQSTVSLCPSLPTLPPPLPPCHPPHLHIPISLCLPLAHDNNNANRSKSEIQSVTQRMHKKPARRRRRRRRRGRRIRGNKTTPPPPPPPPFLHLPKKERQSPRGRER